MGSSKNVKKRRKVAYNNSRTKLFLRCSQAYYYRYDYPREVMGKKGELVARRSTMGLKKGDWMHKLMAAHWAHLAGKGDGWEAKHEELSATFAQFEEEKEIYGDLPAECKRLMTRYLRFYRDDHEKFKIVRLPQGNPAVEFIVEVPLKKWGVNGIFKGQIDLLVRDLEFGGLWIRDAKWVKTIPGPDERMMSPQNILYVWALRHLGHDVRGFIYDYGRTKPPTEPYILQNGTVTLRKNLDTDVFSYLRAIKKAHGKAYRSFVKTIYRDKLLELKARDVLWFDRERIPVEGPRLENGFEEYIRTCKRIEQRGEPVRTYLYNCRWNCPYHEPCVAEFQGMDIDRLLKAEFHVEREKYAVEEIN